MDISNLVQFVRTPVLQGRSAAFAHSYAGTSSTFYSLMATTPTMGSKLISTITARLFGKEVSRSFMILFRISATSLELQLRRTLARYRGSGGKSNNIKRPPRSSRMGNRMATESDRKSVV